MPKDSAICPRMVLISLRDLLPKFLVLSRSDSVFCTRSAMIRIFAVLRQLDARTDSSSSSTLRNRCSLTSRPTSASAPVSAPSIAAGGAWGTSISHANWSSRIRAALATGRAVCLSPLSRRGGAGLAGRVGAFRGGGRGGGGGGGQRRAVGGGGGGQGEGRRGGCGGDFPLAAPTSLGQDDRPFVPF